MTQSTSDLKPERIFKKPDAGARRLRLREFQANLVERMQAARSGADARVSQLGVMIGQTRWLLNLQEAGEIVSVGAVTKVPLTQDWFLGLTNIRGNLVSVVDLARFRGQSVTQIDKGCRIVAFAPALSFNSALLVSRVLGLHDVSKMQPQIVDAGDIAPWAAQSYVDSDSQVWTELKLALVVQDPKFLHVSL